MSALPDFPERAGSEQLSDRFAWIVSVLTVATTLCASIAGYGIAVSSARRDAADAAAQVHGLHSLGQLLKEQDEAHLDFSNFAEVTEVERQQRFFGNEKIFGIPDQERRYALEDKTWKAVTRSIQPATTINFLQPFSPEKDLTFPTKFYSQTRRKSSELLALQDGENRVSLGWASKVTALTSAVTLLAVALYLLGLSLSSAREVRLIFATVGATLFLGATLWGVAIMGRRISIPDPSAARHFADAEVKMLNATEPSDYASAEKSYRRAVELHPEFARAHVGLAESTFAAHQERGLFYSIPHQPDAIETAVEELRLARDLGMETHSVLGNYGYYSFLLGVLGDETHLDESIEATRLAVRSSPNDPVYRFNLAVALLARGDDFENALDDALKTTLYTGFAQEELRKDPVFENDVILGALMDLQFVADEDSSTIEKVEHFKSKVFTTLASAKLPRLEPDGSLSDISITVAPHGVDLENREGPGVDPGKDLIFVVWYHRPSPSRPWAVIPEISGHVTPAPGTGDFSVQTPYTPVAYPVRCLDPGAYRAEVFLNGRSMGTVSYSAKFEPLDGALDLALDGAFCRRASWRLSDRSIRGLSQGFVSPSGAEGAFLFRWGYDPRHDINPKSRTAAILDATVDLEKRLFGGRGPSWIGDYHRPYFMGLKAPTVSEYSYPGGRVLGGAAISPQDRSLMVGIVFGSRQFVRTVGLDILNSYQVYSR